MHSQDTINKFIELRAQNISIRNIADQIGVHRNTLLEWQHKYAEEIDNIRAFELEAIQERLLPKYEHELSELAEEYKRVTAELRTRDYDFESTAFLGESPVHAALPHGQAARPATRHASQTGCRTNNHQVKADLRDPLPRAVETQSLAAHGASLGLRVRTNW
jgi:hypothetical protein